VAHWEAAVDSTAVNPRYRRLVIPGALVGLLLIVVVASLLRG
jgi:hypothetical protein